MTPFFRNLRKTMLGQRRIWGYLGYALGEILLVVIGILLALQIDDWREERELREKEKVYLQEIRNNLDEDRENLEATLGFNSRKDSVITATIEGIFASGSETEAMQQIVANMPVLAEFSIFTQNRVAFDNMLSAESIDLITDDSLRLKLSSYYSVQTLTYGTQDRVKELTRDFVDYITPMLLNRETISGFFGRENNLESAESLNFSKNRYIFGHLFGTRQNLDSHSLFLEGYLLQVDDLITHIDQYLLVAAKKG
ncbi:DUF6090 family protein [Robiginitalea sp. SC105]|uniref:DUF6090 family protein n=1 Tax=Robiginitalea sp. SC105 TaxID=2762332 RepID=UPI00163A1FCB|nr:DUF6090 family protein [Robiginitalea sp. SC105]MBC2837742.1 hypothetical protein [Robiginitalea sp. SC105]